MVLYIIRHNLAVNIVQHLYPFCYTHVPNFLIFLDSFASDFNVVSLSMIQANPLFNLSSTSSGETFTTASLSSSGLSKRTSAPHLIA